MQLVGAGNNIMGGVYVNPYDGLVNGAQVKLICDAFSMHSYIGETWTADVTDFSDLSQTQNTKRLGLSAADQLLYYNQAAWLATQLLSTTNKTTAGHISFALWAVFDTAAMTHLNAYSPGNVGGAQQWLDQARAQTFSPGQFSNVLVYTPNLNYPVRCGAGNCPSSPPQEFLVVTVPEPSAVVTLFAEVGGVGLLLVVLRRRRQKPAA
jgi:hypothetical protein